MNNLIGFILTVILARYLGKAGFGQYSFAITFVLTFIVIMDSGLRFVTTREVARNKNLAPKYLGNIIPLKIFLSIFTLMIIVVVINIMKYPPIVKRAVYIFGVYTIFQSYGHIFHSISDAYEKMHIEVLLNFLLKILILAGVFLVLKFSRGLIEISLVYLIAGFIYLIITFIATARLFAKPIFEFNWKFCKDLLKKGAVFASAAIFLNICTHIDILMLSYMKGDAPVGLYNAALRLMAIFLFIPVNFAKSLYPVFSRLYQDSRETLSKYYKNSFRGFFILAIPLVTGGTLLAHRIILIIYSQEYIESFRIFQVLVWALGLQYITVIFSTLLSAINKEVAYTKVVITATIMNIVLNAIFIPKFSYLGAAISTVITQFFFFASFFIIILRTGFYLSLKEICLKPILAVIIMGIFIYYFRNFCMGFLVPLSIILYFSLLFIFKIVNEEDISLVKQLLGKK